jgi:GNAT superfamily N-acetyltransferase
VVNPQDEQHLDAAPPAEPPRPPRWLPMRSLGPRHRARVLAHLLMLDPADRHLRFGHSVSDEQIHAYVAGINFERDEVFGVFNSRLSLVALAHLAFADDHHAAEFGVSVLPQVRGRGMGANLFEHAVMHARNRGAREMAIYLASENKPMLHIVQRAGAKIRFDGSDATATLTLPEDTLGSRIEALVSDQAADMDYRFKLSALRLDRLWPGRRSGS